MKGMAGKDRGQEVGSRGSGRRAWTRVWLSMLLPVVVAAVAVVLWYSSPRGRYVEREVMRLRIEGIVPVDTTRAPMSLPRLDMDSICHVLACSRPVLYGRLRDGGLSRRYAPVTGHGRSVPGFLLTRGGRMAPDQGAAVSAIVWKDDHLDFFQIPLQTLEGEQYGGECYLMNEQTGSYVTLDVHVTLLCEAPPTLYDMGRFDQHVQVSLQAATEAPADVPVQGLKTILRAVGTQSPALFGRSQRGHISNNYTLRPVPGFWLNSRGRITSLHSRASKKKASVGVCYVDGCFRFSFYPNRIAAGSKFVFDTFFVNEETGDFATLTTTLDVVE